MKKRFFVTVFLLCSTLIAFWAPQAKAAHLLGVETEDRTIYINSADHDTSELIQQEINRIGKHIPNGVTITIQFEGGTYGIDSSIAITDFYGAGQLVIQGNPSESGLHTDQDVYLDGDEKSSATLVIKGCSLYKISVNNLMISTTSSSFSMALDIISTKYVYVSGCYLLGTGTNNSSGIRLTHGSVGYLVSNYVSNLNYGIHCSGGAITYSWGNDDTGTLPAVGLFAQEAGTIGKYSTQPDGSTADEYYNTGGVIR